MAVGHVHAVEELDHLKAAELAHEQGPVFFYRNHGRLYRMHRLGDQFIIIDHNTRGYWVSPLLKEGLIALQPYKSFECLNMLIKHKQPLRGWMEYCLMARDERGSFADFFGKKRMKELYEELKRFF